MAKVITRNQTRSRPVVEVEPDIEEQVEEKAEPTTVVVSKGLATLMTKWKHAFGQFEAYFPQACQYVIENQTTKEELRQALKEYRGMEVPTLNNEVSVIWRVKDHPEEVEACLNKELNPETGQIWTVRELRNVGVKPQLNRSEKSVEDKYVEMIEKIAIYAIKEVKAGLNDFVNQCRVTYREQHAIITGQKVRAQAAAKEANDEEEEETEE